MAHSPVLSSSASESFALVSVSSEEHIVWPLSDSAPRRPWAEDSDSEDRSSADSSADESDDDDDSIALSELDASSDDFVLLRARPRRVAREPSPARTEDELAPAFAELAISAHAPPPAATAAAAAAPPPPPARKPRQKKRRAAKRATPPASGTESSDCAPATPQPSKAQRRKQRRRAAALAKVSGVPPQVRAPLPAGGVLFSAYEEAVRYMNSFLSDPAPLAKDKGSQLALLHALIIELGLYTPARPADALPTPPASPGAEPRAAPAPVRGQLAQLPTSLTAARATLKASAFLNVREYLAKRDGGLDALRAVMYPSRSALARSLHKNPAGRVPVKQVKQQGLNVFLVNCYH